jgi:hypothetical protein
MNRIGKDSEWCGWLTDDREHRDDKRKTAPKNGKSKKSLLIFNISRAWHDVIITTGTALTVKKDGNKDFTDYCYQ